MPRLAGALVTEADLNGQFTPKPGHTPGTDDTILLDCATITDRYYVDIDNYVAGRLPSWDELSASQGEYTLYLVNSNPAFTSAGDGSARAVQDGVDGLILAFPAYPGTQEFNMTQNLAVSRGFKVRNSGPTQASFVFEQFSSGSWVTFGSVVVGAINLWGSAFESPDNVSDIRIELKVVNG